MHPVRLLLATLALSALSASAETVQLRQTGNARTVTFEYITLDEVSIMVKVVDKDAVINYKWEDLDLDWIKKNNPKIWAERELLIASGNAEKKMSKSEAEADPFAVAMTATDAKSLSKNLLISLQDGLKGMPIEKIEIICKEFVLDETLFWAGYDDLKKASKVVGKNEVVVVTAPVVEEPKEKIAKTAKPKTAAAVAKAKNTAGRSAANLEKEAGAKEEQKDDVRPINTIGYLRLLAEGGTKGKPIWMMLRRAPEDRKAILAILRKYDTQAAELAEKPEAKASKGELLTLRAALSTAAESIEKVTRESVAVEARLQVDCRALLNQILPR